MTRATRLFARLRRSRRRSLWAALSLAASVFLVASLEGLLDHLDRSPTSKGGASRLLCHARTSFLEFLPLTYVDWIRAVPGVAAATPYMILGGTYRDLTPQTRFPPFAVDPEALLDVLPEIETVDPSTGRASPELYERFRRDRGSAIAGELLFERFGCRAGDRITH